LFRRVQKKGYSANDFRQILKFLKNYVSFGNEEMLIKFEDETEKPEKSMGIIETVETYYREYGEKEGRKIERSATVAKLFNRGFEVKQIADILEIKEKEVQKMLKDKSLI
jgi:DNA-binding NarL/FixJ family response regulator